MFIEKKKIVAGGENGAEFFCLAKESRLYLEAVKREGMCDGNFMYQAHG